MNKIDKRRKLLHHFNQPKMTAVSATRQVVAKEEVQAEA